MRINFGIGRIFIKEENFCLRQRWVWSCGIYYGCYFGDSSCVYYTIEAIQAGFPKNSLAYNALENLKEERWLRPKHVDEWLEAEGEKYGITRRRVQYQKKIEELENE